MAHYAKVENGIVTEVIVAEQEYFETFVDTTPGAWIQTSRNTSGGIHYDPETGEPSADQSKALRKNYAGIGFTYDADRDAFIPAKPFESWVLNEETCNWEAPTPCPEPIDGYYHTWDESTLSWVQIEIPE